MALAIKMHCDVCGEEKQIFKVDGTPWPDVCPDCKATKEAKEKETFLRKLRSKPLEERIARIEEWLYDHEHQDFSPLNPWSRF